MLRDLILHLENDPKQNYTFGSPLVKKPNWKTGTVLAGDIGGTKTHLAFFTLAGGKLKLIKDKIYLTKNYSSFYKVLQDFNNGNFSSIKIMCLGVAGPVIQGKAKGTNFLWELDQAEITQKTGIKNVLIKNDMEVNAMGLNFLHPEDFKRIKNGSHYPGNAAIIAPGTGLGEVGLFLKDNHYYSFPTEGGHCDFSPRTEDDVAVWRYLNLKYGSVSWERILSGPGIYDLYQFLSIKREFSEPQWFKERIIYEDPAAVISSCAMEGNSEICTETINLFVRYLAIEASILSLKILATGGVYIGGGILPKIQSLVNTEIFYNNYVNSDRMNPILELIPVDIILNQHTALLGAAYCGALNIDT